MSVDCRLGLCWTEFNQVQQVFFVCTDQSVLAANGFLPERGADGVEAAGAATATKMLATSEETQRWIWRVPFLIGGFIAIAGYLCAATGRRLVRPFRVACRMRPAFSFRSPTARRWRDLSRIMPPSRT